MKKRIYTLGYDARDTTSFIKILKQLDIGLAVDVRRFPTSRFPQYTRRLLAITLPDNGIGYEWLGDLLGGYRRGGYAEYMKTQDYWRGIRRLLWIIDYGDYTGHPIILCRERVPWRCHRRFISGTLVTLGYEVYHVVEPWIIQRHVKIY